jgi:hypothetical protein
VLVAMAFTPSLQADFKASCVTVLVTVVAYVAVKIRRRRSAAATAHMLR